MQTGLVDLAVRGRGGEVPPRPKSADFVALDAAWEAEMRERGLAPATCEAYGRVARNFLVFLEARPITALDGADGANVLAFLEFFVGMMRPTLPPKRVCIKLGVVNADPRPQSFTSRAG